MCTKETASEGKELRKLVRKEKRKIKVPQACKRPGPVPEDLQLTGSAY